MCQRATFGRHDVKHIACRCGTLTRYRLSVPFVAFWPEQITPRWQVRSSLQRLCERAPFLSSSCDRRAAAALRVRGSSTDLLSQSLRAFSRVFSCVIISSVCGDLTAVVCYESVWAAELELRRPYVIAHRALPFASAAQQQAPAPRGPILSELASVNGRGGGVLLEQGAPKLQKQKTPPRRGGAPGGKLNTAAFALAPADI